MEQQKDFLEPEQLELGMDCKRCKGVGFIFKMKPEHQREKLTCAECKGTGRIALTERIDSWNLQLPMPT